MAYKGATIDIETTGLLEDMLDYTSFPYKIKPNERLWCVVITDCDTLKQTKLVKEEITKESLKKALEPYNLIIAHNGIKFDFITLKLFNVIDYKIGWLNESDVLFDRQVMFLDTLVVSRLFNPVLTGGHSLEEWGKRLGFPKTNFRQVCIEKGYINKTDTKGTEFKNFVPEMVEYCATDTMVNVEIFKHFKSELNSYKHWLLPIKQEQKLADLAVRRENFGFYFDEEKAISCYEDLTKKIQEKSDIVNPILPPKKANKGELDFFTPPKVQLKKDFTPSMAIEKFAIKHNAVIEKFDEYYYFSYNDKKYKIPFEQPIETHIKADISNLDHVKHYLIELGWIPTEWRERDLTKDSKKINISLEKRIKALDKWFVETMEGKYTEYRLENITGKTPEQKYNTLRKGIEQDFPVRVRTAPSVRVGIEKELCPNLISLGDTVGFAKDFALYLTYKSRRSNIAGGDGIEDGNIEKGYLSSFRKEDKRIPTPAIEIGAISTRYKHISVANIPRITSVYGEEIRGLFGSGEDFLQYGFDFSGLEARVMGHYVFPFERGEELAISMMAEKPNDFHSINSRNLNIPRTEAKSFGYMLIYGGKMNKVMLMLKVNKKKATELYDSFWDGVPALKQFKDYLEAQWEENGETYIIGIDGRKIQTRSKHSILNNIFQSCGVICAKYSQVFMFEQLEKQGYCIDPFESKPDICSMVEYHDESQLAFNPSIIKYKVFETKEEAEQYKNNEGQCSAVKKSKDDKYFIALPNDISISTENAIKKTKNLLKLNVDLGYEWVVGRTWGDCH